MRCAIGTFFLTGSDDWIIALLSYTSLIRHDADALALILQDYLGDFLPGLLADDGVLFDRDAFFEIFPGREPVNSAVAYFVPGLRAMK